MNKFIIAAPLMLLIATPAYATGGLVCRTAGTHRIEVALVISHTVVSSAVSARLTENGRDTPVRIAQSWFEPSEIRLDLVDPQAQRHELRLRAPRNGSMPVIAVTVNRRQK
jgi:hypothetical protein